MTQTFENVQPVLTGASVYQNVDILNFGFGNARQNRSIADWNFGDGIGIAQAAPQLDVVFAVIPYFEVLDGVRKGKTGIVVNVGRGQTMILFKIVDNRPFWHQGKNVLFGDLVPEDDILAIEDELVFAVGRRVPQTAKPPRDRLNDFVISIKPMMAFRGHKMDDMKMGHVGKCSC